MPSENRDGWDCANAATPPPSCTIRTRRILPYYLIFHPSAFRRHIGRFPAGLPAVILPRQLVYGID
ncbi:hypothetical protein M5Y21_00525 [Neisseria meningitidis]|nr:hypothetical protein [Neisseria meningitidis]